MSMMVIIIKILISYNIEDVFLASEHDLGPALEKKIEMLVRGPLSVHKEMDKE